MKIDIKTQTKFEFRLQFGRSQGHPVFPPPHTVKRLLDLSFKIIQNREFQRNAADMTINDLPYGRAERRGTAGLQTKFDQNYLPKFNIFHIKVNIFEGKEIAYGRAERRGGPGLQTKLDQNCLREIIVFR